MKRRSIEEIRKEEIINALFKVISEKGLAGASVREIANVAGCNHGILRYYFGDKDGLIKSALEFLGNKYITTFQNHICKLDSSIDKIKYLFETYRFDKFDIELHRAWVEIFIFSKTSPTISETLNEIYRQIISNIKDIIEKGIGSGEFRDVDLDIITNMIMGYLEGVLFFSVVNTDNTPYELMNKQFTEVILKYLVIDK